MGLTCASSFAKQNLYVRWVREPLLPFKNFTCASSSKAMNQFCEYKTGSARGELFGRRGILLALKTCTCECWVRELLLPRFKLKI